MRKEQSALALSHNAVQGKINVSENVTTSWNVMPWKSK